MPRSGVTREQIFETAEALVHEGRNPTIMGVRVRIGGSPNTIAPLLAEWKALDENRRAEALPPVPEPVEAVMRQVWGAAWKEAQGQLEGEREALAAARQEIEKERADMLAEIGRLDGELEAGREALRRETEALEDERRAHDRTRSQAREAQAVAAEREGRIGTQDAELRQQIGAAHAKASRLEADIGHARKDLERTRAAALANNEQLSRDTASLKQQLKEQKRIIDAGGKKLMKLEGTAGDERRDREVAEKALAALCIEAATLTERAAHADELRALLRTLQAQSDTPKPPARRRTTKPKE